MYSGWELEGKTVARKIEREGGGRLLRVSLRRAYLNTKELLTYILGAIRSRNSVTIAHWYLQGRAFSNGGYQTRVDP